MKIEFDTTEFEFSQGRRPRGRGAWAFIFRRGGRSGECVSNGGILGHSPAGAGSRLANECSYEFARRLGTGETSMPYAEAKAWARHRARALGADMVEVCP